jgi:hypothetical protein
VIINTYWIRIQIGPDQVDQIFFLILVVWFFSGVQVVEVELHRQRRFQERERGWQERQDRMEVGRNHGYGVVPHEGLVELLGGVGDRGQILRKALVVG